MSYQVLARKYRPRRFRELVGQEHVARALVNALDQDRLHHAYLFTGTRGVGKTSIARILAKCLNCETGVSSEPCGQCSTCREVDEGRFIDLIEVDAASRTKVEDTRELLENVQYAPTQGRYKVYLIDEVHMLSTSSFNALLKTLEEPPPHVKFLLATTDPQRLPATVLSRCLQFSLMAMSPERIVEHLKKVLEQEVVAFDEMALWELGRASNGSMRDALSLTDQAIAFGNGRLDVAEVRSMLGSIDRDLVFRVLGAVNSGDAAAVLSITAKLAEQSADFSGALAELVSTLHRVALAQMLPDAVDNTTGDRDSVLAVAAATTAEDVQLFYQIAIQGRRDLEFAADLRSGFEMTLLRMLAFRPVPTRGTPRTVGAGQTPAARPAMRSVPSATPQSPAPQASAVPVAAPSVPAPQAAPQNPQAVAVAHNATPAPAYTSAVAPAATNAARVMEPQVAATAPVAEQIPSNVVPLHVPVKTATQATASIVGQATAQTAVQTGMAKAEIIENPQELCSAEAWEAWLRHSGLVGNGLNLARHSVLVSEGDGAFTLLTASKYELIATDAAFQQVEMVFQQHFPGTQLKRKLGEPAYQTPMQVIAAHQKAKQEAAERNMQADPVVRMLMQDFQAEIIPDSISPLN